MAGTNETVFEWYNPIVGSAIVSIAEYGITFPYNTVEIMQQPKFIKLGYDKKNTIVGVKVCNEEDKMKIPFSRDSNKGKYVRINARDFIRIINSDLGYTFTKAERFSAMWDNENKLLSISLKEVKNRIEQQTYLFRKENTEEDLQNTNGNIEEIQKKLENLNDNDEINK
jgi:uncharacterized protein YcgL (UPF0745 family)